MRSPVFDECEERSLHSLGQPSSRKELGWRRKSSPASVGMTDLLCGRENNEDTNWTAD